MAKTRQPEPGNSRLRLIEDSISEIEALPDSVTESREACWGHIVDRVTVFRNGGMKFAFASCVEIEI